MFDEMPTGVSFSFCFTSYQNFSSWSNVVISPTPSLSARSWRTVKWWSRAAEFTCGMPYSLPDHLFCSSNSGARDLLRFGYLPIRSPTGTSDLLATSWIMFSHRACSAVSKVSPAVNLSNDCCW
jgi:hypothetical protein